MIIGCTRQNSIKFARFCTRLHDNLDPNIAGQKLLFLHFFLMETQDKFPEICLDVKKPIKLSRNDLIALRPRLPCSYMNQQSFFNLALIPQKYRFRYLLLPSLSSTPTSPGVSSSIQ